jgi:hypothetical protein
VKYWEIIADNLSEAGWSSGWVSTLDCEGRTIRIADAHRDDGKRFVVRADEKLDGVYGTGELCDETRSMTVATTFVRMILHSARRLRRAVRTPTTS